MSDDEEDVVTCVVSSQLSYHPPSPAFVAAYNRIQSGNNSAALTTSSNENKENQQSLPWNTDSDADTLRNTDTRKYSTTYLNSDNYNLRENDNCCQISDDDISYDTLTKESTSSCIASSKTAALNPHSQLCICSFQSTNGHGVYLHSECDKGQPPLQNTNSRLNFSKRDLQNFVINQNLEVLVDYNNSGKPDKSVQPSTRYLAEFQKNTKENMGNKQPKSQNNHSDDDTPDDGRTKCCEIPKKKIKEKNGRGNRSSRGDDLNFESNEVYPFEGGARSEQDVHEPVELEPFEIVETDEIKFVPGAGTSDVIKSISNPKFTPIAEEPSVLEEDGDLQEDRSEETNLKVPFFIEKGNKLLEPGTATAHSTFEFRQVKPKTKLSKTKNDDQEPNYENVSVDESQTDAAISGRKASSSSSKSSSSSGSKNVSRTNSKDGITKPARKGKTKTTAVSDESTVITNENKETEKEEKSQKQPSIRDSEIDRNIDNVLMLTQTMFSQATETKDKSNTKDLNQTEPITLTQYENVNVCAKLESTGIKITHKDTQDDRMRQPNTEKAKPQNENSACKQGNCEVSNTKINKRKHYPQLSKDIVEISASGTLIIKSLADLPSEGNNDNEHVDSHDEADETDERTDVKVMYESIDRLSKENKKDTKQLEGNTIKVDNKEVCSEKEHVPPPSPQMMGALEEEDEEMEEDMEENDGIEDDRRKSEILEFTENVCKRLSLLLEGQPVAETDVSQNDNTLSEESTLKKYEDHIYETIDSSYKIVDASSNTQVTSGGNRRETDYVNVDMDTSGNLLTLSARSESSSTLKRTSGDSEAYKSIDTRKSSQSDDDDLPDYFDPRDIPPPRRDSEIMTDSLEFQSENVENNVKVSKETDTVKITSDKMTLVGIDTETNDDVNEGECMSTPIQSFEKGLIINAPSTNVTEELQDMTPTAEAQPRLTALTELANAEEETPVQFDTSGRQSNTGTESDIDISEHRDDLSTDSMLADDEAEETMEILFTKTYTEPVEGAEVFLSCTVVNSAYKEEQKKSETWLSDEALEYFEANASEVMSTAFLKAKKEMKDIQICLQSLRQQMEHFHSDCDDISLPEIPVDSLSPDYFGMPMRKAVTD